MMEKKAYKITETKTRIGKSNRPTELNRKVASKNGPCVAINNDGLV